MQVPVATSSVNVPVEIPISTLGTLVNQVVPLNLFSGEKMDLGNGLQGDLSFQKNGIIRLSPLDSQRIQVTLPLRVQGEVGLKPGGLRNLFQSKIPIDRQLSPVFTINPQLQEDWSLGIREFDLIDLGGKISVSALGLEMDLSPMIRKEINFFAQQQLNNRSDLIRLKPILESLWNQVGRPIFVELADRNMAFSIRPDSVKIREYAVPQSGIHLDLGLKGQILTHGSDALSIAPFPLPTLSANSDQSNHLEMDIPFHLPYADLDRMIQKSVQGQIFRINKKYLFSPSEFRTKAYGDRLSISLDFSAIPEEGTPLSGRLFLVGKPIFNPDLKVLEFEKVDFHLESDNRKASLGAMLKRGKIIRQLNQKMRFSLEAPLEESLNGIKDRLAIRTPYAVLGLSDLEVYPDGFYPAPTGMEIRVKAKGKVLIEWR